MTGPDPVYATAVADDAGFDLLTLWLCAALPTPVRAELLAEAETAVETLPFEAIELRTTLYRFVAVSKIALGYNERRHVELAARPVVLNGQPCEAAGEKEVTNGR